MLTTDELENMRAQLAETRTDSCDVLRRATAKSATGAATLTYAAHLTALSCKREPMSRNRVAQLAEQPAYVNPVTFRVAFDADIKATDRIVHNGAIFEVAGEPRTRGAWALELLVDAVQLKS